MGGEVAFLTAQSPEDELRLFLKLVFSSLKDTGKVEFGVKINLESSDKLKTNLKVTGYQSIEIEESE